MSPAHHLSDDMLLAYSTGALAEPLRVLVASHLCLCESCRHAAAAYEAMGGACLEAIEGEPVREATREAVLARLEACERVTSRPALEGDIRLPEPLRRYVDKPLDALRWKQRGPVAELRLMAEVPGYTARLLRIRPGTGVPDHTHDGIEATLVLQGAFRDSTGVYRRGDVAVADAELDHSPVAEEGEACICFAVTDAPLRLTGKLTRFLNPFLRM